MSYHRESATTAGQSGELPLVDIPEGPDLRVPLQVAADLVFSQEGSHDLVTRTGVTLDLSESGMRLGLADAPPAGTLLSVRLHLPDDEIYVCGGSVVRTGGETDDGEPAWVAIRFVNLSTELRGKLRRCIWDLQREMRRQQDAGRQP